MYLLFLPPWNGITTWFSAFHESIRGRKVRLLHFENGERRERLSHLSLCDRQKEGTSPSIWNASIMMSICEQKRISIPLSSKYFTYILLSDLKITHSCVQEHFEFSNFEKEFPLFSKWYHSVHFVIKSKHLQSK